MEEIKINIMNEISDEDLKVIEGGLRKHNQQFTGNQEYTPCNFVLKENNKVIGGILSGIIWGRLFLNKIWIEKEYRNQGLGTYLLFEAENKAKKLVSMVNSNATGEALRSFFEKYGYKVNCLLEDRPFGFTTYFLHKDLQSSHENLTCPNDILMTEASDEDIKAINDLSSDDYKTITGEKLFKMVYVTATNDQDQIVGGIVSYIGWDYLYVSTLWVDEQYRKQNIGSRLIKALEKYALDFDIVRSFLGTTDFQAKAFYEKLGYVVFGIDKDLPKGYNNYSMKKILNK